MTVLLYTLINVGFTIANLLILGLCLKLYTEILKDKAMDKRSS